jgi:hypothetical protein
MATWCQRAVEAHPTLQNDNRDRGAKNSLAAPPTPPGVRVRTGRFGELRLRGEPGQTKLVEVADGDGHMDEHPRVSPPTPAVAGDLGGAALGETPGA